MRHIYEVVENLMGYPENEKLYCDYLDAEKNFNLRVKEFSDALRLVTDKKVIRDYGYTEGIIVIDRHDTNPNNLKQACILHYPVQCEVEGEPLWCDVAQIDIIRRELL